MTEARISNGMASWSSEPWRVQIYWPEAYLKRGDVFVAFRTTLRVMWREHSRGFGFQILGFGLGVDWLAKVAR